MFLSICLSIRSLVHSSVCRSAYLSFCVSLCPFDFLFVRLSDRLPLVPSIRSAVHPFVCKFLYSCLSLSTCLFVCLSFCIPSLLSVSDYLPACLSVCLSICLPCYLCLTVCLPVYLSHFFSLCIHVHLISLTFSFSICSCKDHRPPAAKRLRH